MPRVPAKGIAGIAVAGYRLWQRLPEGQQQRVIAELRRNGPRIARTAMRVARARKGKA
jgi:hypothetical protein